jgi:hypothetical protein
MSRKAAARAAAVVLAHGESAREFGWSATTVDLESDLRSAGECASRSSLGLAHEARPRSHKARAAQEDLGEFICALELLC